MHVAPRHSPSGTGPQARVAKPTSFLKGGFLCITEEWQYSRVPGGKLGRYPLAGVALAAPPIIWKGTEHLRETLGPCPGVGAGVATSAVS